MHGQVVLVRTNVGSNLHDNLARGVAHDQIRREVDGPMKLLESVHEPVAYSLVVAVGATVAIWWIQRKERKRTSEGSG